MTVTKRLRYEILRRDGNACRYCGAKAPEATLTIDHVIPTALGGSDESTNLVTACRDCNAGKAAGNPAAELVANVADDALRWGAAIRSAAAIQEGRRAQRAQYIATFDRVWSAWTYVGTDDAVERPDAWRDSIGRFHDLGLELALLVETVESSLSRRTRGQFGAFRYLCGTCWRILDERQEIARGLIACDDGDTE